MVSNPLTIAVLVQFGGRSHPDQPSLVLDVHPEPLHRLGQLLQLQLHLVIHLGTKKLSASVRRLTEYLEYVGKVGLAHPGPEHVDGLSGEEGPLPNLGTTTHHLEDAAGQAESGGGRVVKAGVGVVGGVVLGAVQGAAVGGEVEARESSLRRPIIEHQDLRLKILNLL